jgi:hypothetical protein
MVERKNVTEFALAMVNKNSLLLNQGQLDEVEKRKLAPHIYMVLLRSKSTIDIESFSVTKTHMSGVITVFIKGSEKKVPFNIRHQYGTDDIRIEASYPYTDFELIDNDNEEVVLSANVGLLLTQIDSGKNEIPLKVVYVGQSYGKCGERLANDRLVSHGTLQKVYFDVMSCEPNMEVMLYVSEFSCELVTTKFNNENEIIGTQCDFEDYIDNALVVNLVEATLIRYFQPVYNEKFKNKFPSKDHSSYKEAYEMDFNMLRVEVGSPIERFCTLYSDSQMESRHHKCEYHFHGLDERKCMFDFSI